MIGLTLPMTLRDENDLSFLFGCVVAIAALRSGVTYFLSKFLLVLECNQLIPARTSTRLSEQIWSLGVYLFFWPAEMVLLSRYENAYNLDELWRSWPEPPPAGMVKKFYLAQLAFRLFQILVVMGFEAKRKDFPVMLAHHIVSVALIYASYMYRFTRIGLMVLCVLDVVDILLPIVKIFRYLNWNRACNFAFFVFAGTWFVTRHIMFLMICWKVYSRFFETIGNTCFEASRVNSTTVYLGGLISNSLYCFTRFVWQMFVVALFSMEFIFLPWTVFIIGIARDTIRSGTTRDTREEDAANYPGNTKLQKKKL